MTSLENDLIRRPGSGHSVKFPLLNDPGRVERLIANTPHCMLLLIIPQSVTVVPCIIASDSFVLRGNVDPVFPSFLMQGGNF